MTRPQAFNKLRRLYGNRAYYRIGAARTSPEQRAAALAQAREARERIKAIDQEIEERLAALDWYQALKADRRNVRQQAERAQGIAMHYRFTIGKITLGFATITGEGDTWEQAFAKAEATKGGE